MQVGTGEPRLLDLAGDGSQRIPSAVFVDAGGEILVGAAAIREARYGPDRFVRYPKAAIGRSGAVHLDGRDVDAADLVAAILAHVRAVAVAERDGADPASVVLACPARWSRGRRDVLRRAARQAGLGEAALVDEPVAAARHIVGTSALPVRVGELVAVYDLGGGTFDCAVLRRSRSGFELAGSPDGLFPMGGALFDDLLREHVLSLHAVAAHPDAANLDQPRDERWLRRRMELDAEINHVKEELSRRLQATVHLPALDQHPQLTRAELEQCLAGSVQATIDKLLATIAMAAARPADVSTVLLAGAASRMPLVAHAVAATGMRVVTLEDPKSAVALGALLTDEGSPAMAESPGGGAAVDRSTTEARGPEVSGRGRTAGPGRIGRHPVASLIVALVATFVVASGVAGAMRWRPTSNSSRTLRSPMSSARPTPSARRTNPASPTARPDTATPTGSAVPTTRTSDSPEPTRSRAYRSRHSTARRNGPTSGGTGHTANPPPPGQLGLTPDQVTVPLAGTGVVTLRNDGGQTVTWNASTDGAVSMLGNGSGALDVGATTTLTVQCEGLMGLGNGSISVTWSSAGAPMMMRSSVPVSCGL